MKRTLNYTNRQDLSQGDIDIQRVDNDGIRFGIHDLESVMKDHNFCPSDKVFLFVQDKLCVETINTGTIDDLLNIKIQNKTYPVKDKTILHSQDLSIDVHIVNTDGKIKSRTDKIFLGKGSRPQKPGSSKGNIPFDIQPRDIGRKIFEIGDNNGNIVCYISNKITTLADNLKDKSTLEFALLGPIILKEAFIHALITDPDAVGDNLEYWQQCLLDNSTEKELPDDTADLINCINDFTQNYTEKNKLQNTLFESYEGETDA